MLKDGTCTNTQDGTGIQNKRQTRHRSTKNKVERSIASSRLSFHRTGPRCPTSVYAHVDDDDNGFLRCGAVTLKEAADSSETSVSI
jgi:hypothetical protein